MFLDTSIDVIKYMKGENDMEKDEVKKEVLKNELELLWRLWQLYHGLISVHLFNEALSVEEQIDGVIGRLPMRVEDM